MMPVRASTNSLTPIKDDAAKRPSGSVNELYSAGEITNGCQKFTFTEEYLENYYKKQVSLLEAHINQGYNYIQDKQQFINSNPIHQGPVSLKAYDYSINLLRGEGKIFSYDFNGGYSLEKETSVDNTNIIIKHLKSQYRVELKSTKGDVPFSLQYYHHKRFYTGMNICGLVIRKFKFTHQSYSDLQVILNENKQTLIVVEFHNCHFENGSNAEIPLALKHCHGILLLRFINCSMNDQIKSWFINNKPTNVIDFGFFK